MSALSRQLVQETLDRRAAFESAMGDRKCDKCGHLLAGHCSRPLKPNGSACCPGYCFEGFDGEECGCAGYADNSEGRGLSAASPACATGKPSDVTGATLGDGREG